MPRKKKTEEAEPEWTEHKKWFTVHVPVAARSTATYQWGSNVETMKGAEYLIENCVTPERVRHRCVIIEHCERTRRHKTKYRKMVKPKVGSIWKIGKQHVAIKAVLDETICFIRLAIDENKKLVATPDKDVIKGTLVHKMKWSALENRLRYFASSINKAEQKLKKEMK